MATRSKRMPAKPARRRTSGRRSTTGLDARLSALSKRVHTKEQNIARARVHEHRRAEAQREAGDTIRRLTAERDSLRDTLEVVNSQRRIAADERAAAAREVKIAEKFWSDLQKHARKHESFKATKDAVAAVDSRNEKLRQKVSKLEKQLEAAETKTSDARATLAAREKERRDALDAVQRVPNEIRAARGNLTRLLETLKSPGTDDIHRVAASERQFRDALDELRAHTRGSSDNGLVGGLLDTQALDDARERMEDEAGKAAKIRAELAAVQAELHNNLQSRDNDIRTRVLKQKAKGS